jgi:hypothetical protein
VSLYAALSDALAQKPGLVRRFYLGWFKSWVDMLYDRAYSMKLGVTHLPGAGRSWSTKCPLWKRCWAMRGISQASDGP